MSREKFVLPDRHDLYEKSLGLESKDNFVTNSTYCINTYRFRLRLVDRLL